MTLNTIVDEDNNKIAEWYITDPPKGVVIGFLTINPAKCRAILKFVLSEIRAKSEDWYDVPSDKMTLKQARQAVKELRKKLAEQEPKESEVDNASNSNDQ